MVAGRSGGFGLLPEGGEGVAPLRASPLAIAENLPELLTDLRAMAGQRPIEFTQRREPHRLGEKPAFAAVRGKLMRLLVVAILKAVLDAPQEDIGVAQCGGGRPRQQA